MIGRTRPWLKVGFIILRQLKTLVCNLSLEDFKLGWNWKDFIPTRVVVFFFTIRLTCKSGGEKFRGQLRLIRWNFFMGILHWGKLGSCLDKVMTLRMVFSTFSTSGKPWDSQADFPFSYKIVEFIVSASEPKSAVEILLLGC